MHHKSSDVALDSAGTSRAFRRARHGPIDSESLMEVPPTRHWENGNPEPSEHPTCAVNPASLRTPSPTHQQKHPTTCNREADHPHRVQQVIRVEQEVISRPRRRLISTNPDVSHEQDREVELAVDSHVERGEAQQTIGQDQGGHQARDETPDPSGKTRSPLGDGGPIHRGHRRLVWLEKATPTAVAATSRIASQMRNFNGVVIEDSISR